MNIYQQSNYSCILKELSDAYFFIFGNTRYANTFYLFCKENGMQSKIRAFILSDLSRDSRKVHELHGIPVKDCEWLKKQAGVKKIFLGATQKTISEYLIPMFKDFEDINLYSVSDFANDIMYYQYMSLAYKAVLENYNVCQDISGKGYIYISDLKGVNKYKYMSRVAQGVLPDEFIFGGSASLDEIYEKQFGNYDYIESGHKEYQNEKICRIYLAKSHFDKQLKEEYVTPFTETIQVGAALTDVKIANLRDNVGENISARNRDYCEMAAVYWAWKNDKTSDYIGLCHYRRRFVVDDGLINYMIANNYDAVFTVPKLTDGGMREEFVERNYYLTPEMWNLTTQAISKFTPEYSDAWKVFGEAYYILACNMFIMKREVFSDYCAWVFLILGEVDKFYTSQGLICNNRYLGYIAECLLNVYIMKNKEKLKKGFVDVKVLETKS